MQSELILAGRRPAALANRAATAPTPYLLLLAGLVADGILKQITDFDRLSYVPLIAAIAIFLSWAWTRPGEARPALVVQLIVLAAALWSVVELFNPAGVLRPGALTVVALRYVPVAGLWLGPRLLAGPDQRRTVFAWMSVLALLVAAFGLAEYAMGPIRVASLGPGFDPYRASPPWYSVTTHQYVLRPNSFFSAPALAVEFCLASLLASGWLVLDATRLGRGLALVSICGSVVFIAVGGSRVVVIQLVLTLAIMAAALLRSRRLAVPVVAGAVAMALVLLFVPALAERMGPPGELVAAYQAENYVTPPQFADWLASSPMGAGFGITGDEIGHNVEDYYLDVSEDLGAPGLLLFLAALAAVVLLALRRARAAIAPADRFLAVGIAAYTISMAVAMNTGLGLDKPTVAYVFWTFAGLAVARPPVLGGDG